MNQEQEKKDAAQASLAYIQDDCNLGLGTGSTVKHLIENLHTVKEKINALVSSSKETTCKLQDAGFRVDELSAIVTVQKLLMCWENSPFLLKSFQWQNHM